MAFEDRSYSGNAVEATLTSNINSSVTSIPISASTGWPDGTSGPFHAAIAPANDPDNFVEVVRLSGRTGLTLNVQTVPVSGRGWDGTTAASHLVGAVIRHVFTATDADEANQHIVNTGLDHHTQYLTVGRHDIAGRHGFGILPTAGTPSTSAVGDTAASGSSNNIARIDHRHAREVFGSPASSGPINGDGTATSLPRSDHIHAGGVPIVTARPTSPAPIEGQAVINTTTDRVEIHSPTRWYRALAVTSLGRTGATVGRTGLYTIPDAGASSYILPWDTEVFDSDGLIPAPDGTTTYTLTCPSVEASGLYFASCHLIWDALFTQRSYIEIIHNFSGGSHQHRVTTTGEDRGTVAALLELANTDTVQFGLWQNSGAPQDVAGAYMQLYRISP